MVLEVPEGVEEVVSSVMRLRVSKLAASEAQAVAGVVASSARFLTTWKLEVSVDPVAIAEGASSVILATVSMHAAYVVQGGAVVVASSAIIQIPLRRGLSEVQAGAGAEDSDRSLLRKGGPPLHPSSNSEKSSCAAICTSTS